MQHKGGEHDGFCSIKSLSPYKAKLWEHL